MARRRQGGRVRLHRGRRDGDLGDAAKLREGWTEALGNLDAIPKARRKPMHCYWRALLLYRLRDRDQADAARIACTGELLRATAPAADKRADAIDTLAGEAAAAARRGSQDLLSQCSEERREQLGELSGCQLELEAERERLNATTGDLRSLQKRLGDLKLRVRELTSDPQIRKRIESVESLKAAKGQLTGCRHRDRPRRVRRLDHAPRARCARRFVIPGVFCRRAA